MEILLCLSSDHMDQVSPCSNPSFLRSRHAVQLWKEGHAFSPSIFFFFPLKEMFFLVFPKREQQQRANEGAPPLSRSCPSTSQFFGLPYKSPCGKWVQAVGSFLLGSGGLWTDARILPQTPLYEWSVAERENIPNFFPLLPQRVYMSGGI